MPQHQIQPRCLPCISNLRRRCIWTSYWGPQCLKPTDPLWEASATTVSGPKSLGLCEWGPSKARSRNQVFSIIMALVTELPFKCSVTPFYCLPLKHFVFHLQGLWARPSNSGGGCCLTEDTWTQSVASTVVQSGTTARSRGGVWPFGRSSTWPGISLEPLGKELFSYFLCRSCSVSLITIKKNIFGLILVCLWQRPRLVLSFFTKRRQILV